MSHVVKLQTKILSLAALSRAAAAVGLQFREGQTTYRWYGRHVGDYPLPEGFIPEDLGRCAHALSVPGNERAYEVGVVPSRTGEGFELLFDFYSGGFGLMDKVGPNCDRLMQRYSAEVVAETMGDQWMVEETAGENGAIVLTLSGGMA